MGTTPLIKANNTLIRVKSNCGPTRVVEVDVVKACKFNYQNKTLINTDKFSTMVNSDLLANPRNLTEFAFHSLTRRLNFTFMFLVKV